MKKRLLSLLAYVAVLYALSVVVARFAYRRFLYPAPGEEELPIPDGATLLTVPAKDGVVVHALDFPPDAAKARDHGLDTVVLFHGNGERMEWGVDLAARLRARGFAVVLVEYRGYGRSRGATPSEEGLYEDAEAVLDGLAAAGVGPEHVILWGRSLGTGVATEMARRGKGSALVLLAPFTSIRAVASYHAPWLPMSLILPDRYDNLAKARDIHVPTLIAHGDKDPVVPYVMGVELSRAIPGARLETVHGGAHMDQIELDGDRIFDQVLKIADQ